MRENPPPELAIARVVNGPGKAAAGMLGQFLLEGSDHLFVATSSGVDGWEHVCITTDGKLTWADILLVRLLFWEEDEVVVIYPSEAVHLWKPLRDELPIPWRTGRNAMRASMGSRGS